MSTVPGSLGVESTVPGSLGVESTVPGSLGVESTVPGSLGTVLGSLGSSNGNQSMGGQRMSHRQIQMMYV